ncbi:uncharacterized protein LOC132544145 [Ylistrum balloti]|uniref:uncharacterized protein LOC132544145 n=1 Tax=Ylistrum balloti TaxID=509963 RepID=UPI002905C3F1|nr:uncharacterized protein LOC132544145 [Ylistrum balloti]
MEYSNVAAIIITVIGVISVIFCGVGYGISDTQKSTGEALSIVGFVIGVLMLIATIFIVIQAKFTVINKKKCDGPEGQEGKRKPVDPKPRNEATVLSTRSIGSPTSTSKIKTKFRNNQVSDSNESDVDTTTPRGKSALDSVPPGRKLPPINISSVPNVPEEPEKVKKKKKKVKKSYKDDKQDEE